MPDNRHVARTHLCTVCGGSFTARTHNARYCSNTCYLVTKRKREGATMSINCAECGHPMTLTRKAYRNGRRDCAKCTTSHSVRSWDLFDEVVVLRLLQGKPVGERLASYPEIAAWSLLTGLNRCDQAAENVVFRSQSRRAVCEEWITSPYDKYRELARVALERWK